MPKIKYFKGLNNVSDPLRLGLGWLATADNVDVTDTGGLRKRFGFTLTQSGAVSSLYATLDTTRMYLVKAGAIKTPDGTTLAAVTSTAPMYWAEINDQVFFNNGTDRGVILPDNTVLPWAWPVPTAPNVAPVTGNLPAGTYQVRCSFILADGRETGTGDSAEIILAAGQAISITGIPQTAGGVTRVYIAPADNDVYSLAFTTYSTALVWNSLPDSLGEDLRNIFLDPIPVGADVIQFFKGRAYASQYMTGDDQTVIWYSEPLGFHLFNLNSNYFIVPGQVLMLAPTPDALIVGTNNRVYAYADKLVELAQYGVVAGQHWALDLEPDGPQRTLFWTTRGVCSALPFVNLTEKQVSVAPGVRAGGALVRSGGQKRYVVAIQQGGNAFNPFA